MDWHTLADILKDLGDLLAGAAQLVKVLRHWRVRSDDVAHGKGCIRRGSFAGVLDESDGAQRRSAKNYAKDLDFPLI